MATPRISGGQVLTLQTLPTAVVLAATSMSPAGFPTTWDGLFAKWGQVYRIPVPYLRALAKRESDFKPYNTSGGAWGLLEVVMDVVRGFNSRTGHAYTSQDRLDPDKNVEMATWQLREIIKSYQANHSTRNLQENWNNPEFVALLTMGWNSGYSELGGVGRVVDYLAAHGISVTAGNVAKYASAAGASHYLAERGAGWARIVTQLYLSDRENPVSLIPGEGRIGGVIAWAGLAAVAGATGLALAIRAGRRVALR